jgi:hypothetical protein
MKLQLTATRILSSVGGLSKPSKMPGWAYGIPAKECKTGSKLRQVKGSTCEKCYALKGCYVFKVVQEAQYKRLAAIKKPGLGPGHGALDLHLKNLNTLDGMILATCRT